MELFTLLRKMSKCVPCKPHRRHKRKLSGYSVYVQMAYDYVKIKKPGMTSRGVFSELAKQWKALPLEQKCRFRELAKEKNKNRH